MFSNQLIIHDEIYTNRFGKYYIPNDHDRIAANRLRRGLIHEEATLKLIEQLYQPKTDIIYAGTYFGDMLPFYSKLAETATVWAFEPVKENFMYASINIKLNNIKNVNLFNCALSTGKTQKCMRIQKDNLKLGGGSYIINKDENLEASEIEIINTKKLDDLIPALQKPIGLIQLDVEGHEYQALKGAEKIIKKFKPIIIIEVWEEKNNRAINYIKHCGYEFYADCDLNKVFIHSTMNKL
jgi:FkbM family methyltransferase